MYSKIVSYYKNIYYYEYTYFYNSIEEINHTYIYVTSIDIAVN